MNTLADQPEASASHPPAHWQPGAPGDIANNDSNGNIEGFTFSGRGSEYFRIWIVNLLLSLITLGIYSAWAKVRRQRYFYNNTTLAGSSFDYHGNPVSILKGRFIAFALLLAYQLMLHFAPRAGMLLLGVFGLAMPWLVWRSLQFKLYNSSYRGIRFGFRGSAGAAYLYFLVLPVISVFTLYVLAPLTHQRLKRFQHEQSRYGASHFSFDAPVGSFYKIYLLSLLFALVGVVAIAFVTFRYLVLIALTPHLRLPMMLAFYGWLFLMYPFFLSLLQNLVWNHTRLGTQQLRSNVQWRRMVFIAATNLIGIVCTLGLFVPFAKIRSMRYQIESMSVVTDGNLDQFIAANAPTGSVTGEGMSDLLDFDLSL